MIYCIYKIVCEDNNVNYTYVGSTQSFRVRKAQHKSKCNNEKANEYNCKLYKTIRDNGGWNNFRMVCIDEVEVNSKRQAEIIEEKHRMELRANLNDKRCHLTQEQRKEYLKEYRENNAEKIKEYYDNNAEKIKEQRKEYYENNAEKIREQKKEYYDNNAEKIKERHKDYYDNNAEKIKERNNTKCECECGGKYTNQNKSKHIKTNKHKKYLNENKDL